jgi:hypothetical protein
MFKKINKNSKQMAVQVMRDVANQAFKLSTEKAKECLKDYYNNYKPGPHGYRRTYQLHKSIRLIKPVEKSKNGMYIIGFAVKYDSSRLDGLYRSNSWYHQGGGDWISRKDSRFNSSSQNNGIVESSFILENYLHGIHPWAQTDPVSTHETMTQFFQSDLPSVVGSMIYKEMQNAVLNFLTSNGGGK